jgi:hypothetical protein
MTSGIHKVKIPDSPMDQKIRLLAKKLHFPKYKLILLIILILWTNALFLYRSIGANKLINFYAVILDEGDRPIPGVDIQGAIVGWNPLGAAIPFPYHDFLYIKRDRSRRTNKDGSFRFNGYFGEYIQFSYDSFKKTGYEFIRDGTPTRFDQWRMPDPKNPIVYRMRKLEEPTFLLRRGGGVVDFSAKNDEHVRCYDWIFEQRFGLETTVDHNKRPLTRDLVISSKWEESENRWAITFAPGTRNDGIQISNRKLYTAPSDGYMSEVTFYRYKDKSRFIYLKESPDKPFEPSVGTMHVDGLQSFFYFYLKSRECELYSRIEIQTPRLERINGVCHVF